MVEIGAVALALEQRDLRVPHPLAVVLQAWRRAHTRIGCEQLDHITPHHQTQDDGRENLQMLCACCHAVKSAMEAAAR